VVTVVTTVVTVVTTVVTVAMVAMAATECEMLIDKHDTCKITITMIHLLTKTIQKNTPVQLCSPPYMHSRVDHRPRSGY
jgi:hypothetical protein